MSDTTNRRVLAVAASVLLAVFVLLAAYMGAYYFMLVDRISLASPPAPGVPFDLMLTPAYRVENDTVKLLLEPAHQVDQRIRPNYWH